MNNVQNQLDVANARRIEFCPIHGEYESRRLINILWSKCLACSTEAMDRSKNETEERERIRRIDAWHQKIGRSGIPYRFQERTLDSFIATIEAQTRALMFARAYADHFDDVLATRRSAVFVGKPGTGKTHLAAGIGIHVMHQGRSVFFTSVFRAIRRIKGSWKKDSVETETQAVNALVFPDLLILDEVGQQFGSETEKLLLFDVLNERYENRKPTLLLANVPLDDYSVNGQMTSGLKSFLGTRVIDRLREDGGEFVSFGWGSYRGKSE